MIKTYLSSHELDFLWKHLKDLKNQSCEIILEKLEKYYTSDYIPIVFYFNELKQYTCLKVKPNSTVLMILQENFLI